MKRFFIITSMLVNSFMLHAAEQRTLPKEKSSDLDTRLYQANNRVEILQAKLLVLLTQEEAFYQAYMQCVQEKEELSRKFMDAAQRKKRLNKQADDFAQEEKRITAQLELHQINLVVLKEKRDAQTTHTLADASK